MKLTAIITTDSRGFERGMNKTLKSARMAAGKIAASFSAAFGTAAIVVYTKKLIDFGDQIGKTAKRIGITAEEFQKIAFAARRSGASTTTVEKAFKRMASTIEDAKDGLKTAQLPLEKIGVSLDDLKGKSPEKQFEMMAQALSKVQDATTKAALAQDIFGRAGTEIIPMLDDYAMLATEIEELGGIMSNEAVEAAEKFKDSMENLGVSIQGLVANSGLLEWLAKVAEGMDALFNLADKLEKRGGTSGKLAYQGGAKGVIGDLLSFVTGGESGEQFSLGLSDKETRALDERRRKVEQLRKSGEKSTLKEIQVEAAQAKQKAAKEEISLAKTANKRAKLEERIAKIKEQMSATERKDKFAEMMDNWNKKIGKLSERISAIKSKITNVGGSFEKGILLTKEDINENRQQERLEAKIRAANRGEKVSFSQEETARIKGLEGKRKEALNLMDVRDKTQGKMDTAKREADRVEREKTLATRTSQIEEMTKKISELLEQRLPGAA